MGDACARRKEPALNAENAAQLRLLELQEHDSRLDQLTHRARTLPEHASIDETTKRQHDLTSLVVAAQTEVSDIEVLQAKADADVEQVRQRAARDQERLNSGAVTSAKDLEALQHEVATLARRQNELEDTELEVMERLEDASRHLDQLTAERDQVVHTLSDLVAARDAALAELQTQAQSVGQERAAILPSIPPELLALYTKLREQNAGIGAARLHQRRCEGCRMELSPVDLGRIREAEPDEVLRCEQCRRILVRTNESGL